MLSTTFMFLSWALFLVVDSLGSCNVFSTHSLWLLIYFLAHVTCSQKKTLKCRQNAVILERCLSLGWMAWVVWADPFDSQTHIVWIGSLVLHPPPPPVLRSVHFRSDSTYTTIIFCQSVQGGEVDNLPRTERPWHRSWVPGYIKGYHVDYAVNHMCWA